MPLPLANARGKLRTERTPVLGTRPRERCRWRGLASNTRPPPAISLPCPIGTVRHPGDERPVTGHPRPNRKRASQPLAAVNHRPSRRSRNDDAQRQLSPDRPPPCGSPGVRIAAGQPQSQGDHRRRYGHARRCHHHRAWTLGPQERGYRPAPNRIGRSNRSGRSVLPDPTGAGTAPAVFAGLGAVGRSDQGSSGRTPEGVLSSGRPPGRVWARGYR